MLPRPIQTLFQLSKTPVHLSQLVALLLKSSVLHHPSIISHLILSSCSISPHFSKSIFDKLPVTPPVFAFNTLIRAYADSSTPHESVKLFSQLQRIGLRPDNFTYPFVVKACGRCLMAGNGGAVHSMVLKVGFCSDKHVGNTIVRMYGAFGMIRLARQMFDEMLTRDVVSWSSIIAGYISCNYPLDAIKMFQQMKSSRECPNSVTLVSLVSACTHLLNIRAGKSIHSYVIVNGMGLDVALGTALLEIYSKCGWIEQAFHVFNLISEKNLQTWTVMISCLSDHRRGEDAMSLFSQMVKAGLKPDSVSFSAILSACSHLGLVNEGQKYFDQMGRIYGIEPTIEHYGCMVDLLGRAGLIEQAFEIIKSMPMEPNSVIVRSFLSACGNHGRVICLEDNLTKLLHKLEPDLGANYVLSANVSSLSGCPNDAAFLRTVMKEKGMKKVPGCSWVEVTGGFPEEKGREIATGQ